MRGWLKLLAIGGILVALFDLGGTAAADGQTPRVKPESGPWNPTGSFSFEGDEGDIKKLRRALSGIACHDPSSGQHRCLVVFDEGVEARYVIVEGGSYRLENEKVILATGNGELDAEAAATDGQYYYITGSHSVKRESCEPNPSSRRVIRIAIDPATGKARHQPDYDPVGESDRSHLWSLMNQSNELKNHLAKCLNGSDQGVNIEGLAIKDGGLYFGFRGPTEAGLAKILRVAAEPLFTGGNFLPTITNIEVAEGLGIRDLQAVKDGFLLLVGPDDSKENENRSWIIYYWNGAAGDAAKTRVLAELDLTGVKRPSCDKEPKPEALAVTEDASDHYKIVVLSDGLCDGGPLAFRIAR